MQSQTTPHVVIFQTEVTKQKGDATGRWPPDQYETPTRSWHNLTKLQAAPPEGTIP